MAEDHLYSVDLPYANFGVITDNTGQIIKTAPIGKWMIGKYISYVTRWVKGKGGTIIQVN